MPIRFPRPLPVAVFLCACFLMAVPRTASATLIFYSHLMTGANTCIGGGAECFPDNDNTGQQLSVDTLGPLTSTTQGPTGATATGFAEIVDGVLHASASGRGGAGFFEGFHAEASAIFLDTLKFESTSLPTGTLVQLAWAIDLDYTLSGACDPTLQSSRSFVHARLHSFSFDDDTCDAFDVNNGAGVTTVRIGDELAFQAILTVDTTGPGPASVAGLADAAHTFRFTIDPLGAFFYTTASGNSYATQTTPVPEPASLMLVGTGVAAVFGARYRRRRSCG